MHERRTIVTCEQTNKTNVTAKSSLDIIFSGISIYHGPQWNTIFFYENLLRYKKKLFFLNFNIFYKNSFDNFCSLFFYEFNKN